MPQRGSLPAACGRVLSFLSEAREASGSETARVRRSAGRHGNRLAAKGARTGTGDPGDRVFQLLNA
jgi:hypothetical protein